MKRNTTLVRNLDALFYLEVFIVCAVASVLIIRLFLHLTGYPQIGNGTLHIAHMLWGGLLMLISIIMLFSFIGKHIELWAAILGGIGFGTFIDEVGKFVTSDNDYFFEPSISIMYIIFVLIILSIHMIRTGWSFTRKEYLVNALKGLEEVALADLDQDVKDRVIKYLDKSDPENPFAKSVRDLVSSSKLVPMSEPGWYTKVKISFRDFYAKIVSYKYFRSAIVIFFVGKLLLTLTYIIVFTFFIGLGWDSILDIKILDRIAEKTINLSFIDKAKIFSSLLSGVFVFLGVYFLRKSRLVSYQMFERSVLVSILLTYVFIFYKEQFAALAGLAVNILILIALRLMIQGELGRPASA
jgi:hypothetical protein